MTAHTIGIPSIILCFLMLCLACGESKEQRKTPAVTAPSGDKTEGDDSKVTTDDKQGDSGTSSGSKPTKRTPCKAPDGANTDPQTIEEVITLLNKMPKPVTIACFMDVLDRPFYLNATASQLSVQPAVSEKTPRIFIFRGASLIITFVPAGEGSKTVEFSYLLSGQSSVKGELGFPVMGELAPDAAYSRVKNRTGDGTTCEGCHANEVAAGDDFAAGAYASKALKPFVNRNVTLFNLERELRLCADQSSSRCDIIESIFRGDDVEAKDFPSGMSTIF